MEAALRTDKNGVKNISFRIFLHCRINMGTSGLPFFFVSYLNREENIVLSALYVLLSAQNHNAMVGMIINSDAKQVLTDVSPVE